MALRIAFRQLLARRAMLLQLVLAVALPCALLAVVVAVTVGENQYLRRRLRALSPAVTLQPERLEPLVPSRLVEIEGAVVELVVNTPPSVRREIKPRVEVATRARRSSQHIGTVAPFVSLEGVFRNGARYSTVSMRGVDPGREKRSGRIAPMMRAGSLDALEGDPDGTIIGLRLAQRLGVRRGGTVTAITAAGVVRRLHVVGVFRSDVTSADDHLVIVNLELAQTLRGMARNAASGLALQVRDAARDGRVAVAAERATGYRAITWEQEHAEVLRSYGVRMLGALLVAALVVVAAGFLLANIIGAAARRHERSFIALEQMGAESSLRARLIMLQGMLVGVIGGLVGAGLAATALVAIARARSLPLGLVEDFVRFDRVPVLQHPAIYLGTLVVAITLGVAASIVPARRRAGLS
jgi:lipoprotein-releasing system permease protein